MRFGLIRAIRFILSLLDVAFLGSLILLPAIWLSAPLILSIGGQEIHWPWRPLWVAVPPLFLLVRFGLKTIWGRLSPPIAGFWESALFKKLTLAVATPFLFLLSVEQVLQWAGYEAYFPPIIIQDDKGSGVSDSQALIADAEFRWRFVPGAEFRGRKVNQLGFLDREVEAAKPEGTIRVICLGDSITAQGAPPYSGRLHRRLVESPPTGRPWEAFNMAVHGYSSVIGLRLFERRVKLLQPDIVTIYFGWNDHWLGGRMPDSVRLGVRMNRWEAGIYEMLKKKRFGQWLLSHIPSENPRADIKKGGYYRVPPDEYVATIRRLVEQIRASGAIPILITAPRTERPSEILVKRGNAESVEEIIRLHDLYIDLTRQVALDMQVPLLDLAKLFDGLNKKALMQDDGIHMTLAGLDQIADALYAKLVEIARTEPRFQ